MDLFDFMREDTLKREAPLASRLRPEKLDEIVGQRHILGKDKLLYRAIKADKLGSLIFYGPPGTGKTTLAMVIANTTSSVFRQINATSAGKKDMEEVVAEAKQAFAYGKRTILFIDEIHRFNKGQQDYLLPFVEDGTIILIGATTENPYFEVNSALLSRSRIFELKPLEAEDIRTLVYRAVTDPVKGMGSYNAEITDEAEQQNPNNVKVVTDKQGYALYFSRSLLPFPRHTGTPVYKHIGIYAYKRDFLLQYAKMAETPLEHAESLEQLRALENGYRIKVIETKCHFVGVDTAEDLEKVREIYCNLQ